MSEGLKVWRIGGQDASPLTERAERWLLAGGVVVDDDDEESWLAYDAAWNRRHMYDGPPQWSAEERVDRLFEPDRMLAMLNGHFVAPGNWRHIVATKQEKSQLAELSNKFDRLIGILSQQAQPAPATAGDPPAKKSKTSRAPIEEAPVEIHPVSDGIFAAAFSVTRNTTDSVVFKELVGGRQIESYPEGYVGDFHLRSSALEVGGLLKRQRKGNRTVSDSKNPFVIVTVNMDPTAEELAELGVK